MKNIEHLIKGKSVNQLRNIMFHIHYDKVNRAFRFNIMKAIRRKVNQFLIPFYETI